MPFATLLLMLGVGAEPSPCLAAAFRGELRLVLVDTDVTPRPNPHQAPPIAGPDLPPPALAPPAGSRTVAFFESSGLELIEALALDALGALVLAGGTLSVEGGLGQCPACAIPAVVLGAVPILASRSSRR